MEDDVWDNGHHHQLEEGALTAPNVSQTLHHVGQGRAALSSIAGTVKGGPQRKDHRHVGQIQHSFDDEIPEIPQGEYEDAAHKRPDDAGAGDGQHVGGHGVAEHFPGHGASDEGLAHGLGHGTAGAGQDYIQVGVPHGHAPGQHQQGEAQCQSGHHQLQRDDQPAPVEAVAEDAAPGADHQAGQGVDAAHGDHQQTGDGGTFRQVADQPTHAQQLYPLGVVGEEITAP